MSISTQSRSAAKSPDYVLGHSEHEQARLQRQADILRGWTEKFLRDGGLQAGMAVLDVGCGMGDVSFQAAEIVGPKGRVLGIDREAGVLDTARMRAEQFGCADRVNFASADLDEFQAAQQFDAIVGRYVLMYQRDPAETLRNLMRSLRPGGVVIFHEIELNNRNPSFPEVPLWDRFYAVMGEAFARGGALGDCGRRLAPIYLNAGLPWPTVRAEIPVASGPGSYLYGWVASTIKTLLPRIEQCGLATAEELDVDTLAARFEQEVVARGAQIYGPPQFGAWAVKPA